MASLLPRDTPGKLLIASIAVLYVGLAIGLPLVLSHRATSEQPNAALLTVGSVFLAIGFIAPAFLVARTAFLLNRNWLLFAVLALVFHPLGTFLSALYLWDQRASKIHGAASAAGGT